MADDNNQEEGIYVDEEEIDESVRKIPCQSKLRWMGANGLC